MFMNKKRFDLFMLEGHKGCSKEVRQCQFRGRKSGIVLHDLYLFLAKKLNLIGRIIFRLLIHVQTGLIIFLMLLHKFFPELSNFIEISHIKTQID